MKKWIWKETAEVIGVLGIIAGLVFLGFELRQNNELLAAEARFNYQQVRDSWFDRLSDPQISQLIVKARNGDDLSASEQHQLFALYNRLVGTYEWAFLEGTVGSGVLRETELRSAFGKIPGTETYALPGLRETWDRRKAVSPPEFVEFMDQNIVVAE